MRKICKKCTATLLSVALLLSCIITGTFTSAEGTPAGTEADPIMITTADQLLEAVKSKTATYYKLANDIVINDIKVIIGEDGVGVVYDSTGTTPLADGEKANLMKWNEEMIAFAGTLDGDGHIVRGLYVNGETTGSNTTNARGLINKVTDGAQIKNLGLEDVYVSYTGGTAAGFIGNSDSADVTVENCYVDDSAYFYGYNVGIFLGSGSRENATATIKNCYSQATFDVYEYTDPDTEKTTLGDGGTLAGNIWGTSNLITWVVDGFYSTETYVSAAREKNRFTNTNLTKTNAYEDVVVDGNSGTAFDGNTFFPGYGFAAVEGGLPTLKVFKNLDEDMWGGLADSSIKGAGTEAEPYLITTGEQLAYVAANNGKIKLAGEYFKLTNDIYLNNVFAEDWKANAENNVWNDNVISDTYSSTSIRFVGNLDGDGYCIYGIWYPENTTAYSAGLFPNIGADATVKNLGIKESQIMATNNAAGFSAVWDGDSAATFSSCFVDDTVTVCNSDEEAISSEVSVGGIIGYTMSCSEDDCLTIENCYSAATLTAKTSGTGNRVNGLIGTSWKSYYKIVNSYSIGYRPFYAQSENVRSWLTNGGVSTVTADIAAAYKNVYSDTGTPAKTEVVDGVSAYTNNANMFGADALESMTGFESAVWYAVKDDTKSPMLRVHGTAIGDVDEDGVGLTTGDAEALRKHLIDTAQALNGNYNKDDATDIDILDLVELTLAQKKNNP